MNKEVVFIVCEKGIFLKERDILSYRVFLMFVGKEYDSRRLGKSVIPSERLNALRYSWDDSLNTASQGSVCLTPLAVDQPGTLPVDAQQSLYSDSLFYHREDGMPDPRVKIEIVKPSRIEKILAVIKFWKK